MIQARRLQAAGLLMGLAVGGGAMLAQRRFLAPPAGVEDEANGPAARELAPRAPRTPAATPGARGTPAGDPRLEAAQGLAARCDFAAALATYDAVLGAGEDPLVRERRSLTETAAREFDAGLLRLRESLVARDAVEAGRALGQIATLCSLPLPLTEIEREVRMRRAEPTRPPAAAAASPARETVAPTAAVAASTPAAAVAPSPRMPTPTHLGSAPAATPAPVTMAEAMPGLVPAPDPLATATMPAPARATATATPVAAPPAVLGACAAASAGRFAEAARLLEGIDPGLIAADLEDMAGVVFFNASYQAVRDRRCDEGIRLARLAARHDDPWRLPSNFGWLRTLEQVPDCFDFNLEVATQVIRPKPLPALPCGVRAVPAIPAGRRP